MQSNNSNGYVRQSDFDNLARRFDQLVTNLEDFMLQFTNRVQTPPRVEREDDAQLPEPDQEAVERSAFEEAKEEPKRRKRNSKIDSDEVPPLLNEDQDQTSSENEEVTPKPTSRKRDSKREEKQEEIISTLSNHKPLTRKEFLESLEHLS